MKPETLFQNKVIRALKQIPNLWYVKVSQKTVSGTPDLLICANGRFVALELKASPKATISRLQAFEINAIIKAGGVAYICDPEDFDFVMKKLKALTSPGVVPCINCADYGSNCTCEYARKNKQD